MRLDLYLKKAMLVKRREIAAALCEEGLVRVNGIPRKSSFDVNVGDELLFPLFNRVLRGRILGLPEGNVTKNDQWALFELLEEKRLAIDEGWGEEPFLPKSKPPRSH